MAKKRKPNPGTYILVEIVESEGRKWHRTRVTERIWVEEKGRKLYGEKKLFHNLLEEQPLAIEEDCFEIILPKQTKEVING